MWLPEISRLILYGILKPDPEITLTIPSATDKAISVGAYDTVQARWQLPFRKRFYKREQPDKT